MSGSKKSGLFLIVLLAMSLIAQIPFVKAAWLTGWGYRNSHEITGSSHGAVTDYQMGIKVYYSDGTDGIEVINAVTFGKVYVDSKCETDFGDIRFTSSDGSTELDYYMIDMSVSNYAVFWVEVDSIPADPDTKTIYVYYGKVDSTTSDGDATFLLFDHFDDSSIDGSKWTDDTQGGGAISESGTVLVLDVNPEVSSDSAGVRSIMTFTNDIAIVVKRRQTVNNGYYCGVTLASGTTCDANGGTSGWWMTTAKSGYYWRFYRDDHTTSRIYEMPVSGGQIEQGGGGVSWPDTIMDYVIWDSRYSSAGALYWYMDESLEDSGSDTTFLASSKVVQIVQGSYALGNYGADTHVDYAFVRKFVDPEPEHTDWGLEDVVNTPSIPTLVFGAGFNASSPHVELCWTHDLSKFIFFEVQNSTNSISWDYLGVSTTTNYTDSQVMNGTARYYKVRACNQTGGTWYNSSFADVNFETVYFIMVGADGEDAPDYSIVFLAIGLILMLAIAFLYVKDK